MGNKINIIVLIFIVLFSSCGNSGRKHMKENAVANTRAKRPYKEKVNLDVKLLFNTKVMTGIEIFKRYNSAVFMVFTSDGYNTFQGSGFFISSNGIAVSNYHVFKGTSIGLESIILSSGEELKIEKVIDRNDKDDFIIFQVQRMKHQLFNYIPVTSRSFSVGEKVYVISSPRGMENTFSSGEISQKRDHNIIQISVPIDHGSSGGALINSFGEAIGITSGGQKKSNANLNYSIDINVIRKSLSK